MVTYIVIGFSCVCVCACVQCGALHHDLGRPVGRGGSRGSIEPPFAIVPIYYLAYVLFTLICKNCDSHLITYHQKKPSPPSNEQQSQKVDNSVFAVCSLTIDGSFRLGLCLARATSTSACTKIPNCRIRKLGNKK